MTLYQIAETHVGEEGHIQRPQAERPQAVSRVPRLLDPPIGFLTFFSFYDVQDEDVARLSFGETSEEELSESSETETESASPKRLKRSRDTVRLCS